MSSLPANQLPREVLFRESQRLTQWWVWLLIAAIAVLAWWTFVQQILYGRPFGSNPAPDVVVWIIFVLFGVGLPAFFLLARLVTEVDASRLRLHYIPLRDRRIPIGDIQRVEVVTYRPIRHFGGWGIRWAPGRGWAYNVRGNRGVQLELTGGKRLLVGSQRPEELADALTPDPLFM